MTRALTLTAIVAGTVAFANGLHDPAPVDGGLPTIGDSPVLTLRSAEWQDARARLTVAEWVAAHPPPAPTVEAPRWSADWDGIAECETGSNWQMVGSTYSGGLGFYNGAWNDFGGRQFATRAGHATKAQQITVAERIYARHGLTGWGCRRYG